MYAVFDETLVTGNEMIDVQHKELIGKIADLEEACETHRDKETAVKLLKYLAEYTDFHLAAVEMVRDVMV